MDDRIDSPSGNDSFKTSIMKFLEEAEGLEEFKLSKMCEKFNFQRRRFYDVINVLETIGCCQHESVDTIKWIGKDNITQTLNKIAIANGVENELIKLKEIIPKEKCDTIGKITQLCLLLFLALKRQTLNIRQIAVYLSRGKNITKTILCKLYQITFILSAASVLEKTNAPCEVKLCDKYFNCVSDPDGTMNKYSINSLLISRTKNNEPFIDLRRKEFEKYCKYVAMKQVVTDHPKKVRKILV
ncbi:hypothetical protein TVAG_237470 [Trichomonas vaginalis G3]|uniref:E2F/DP family winged-helix DNA-binding domain-containing protein n=1 Tax=Trichomonas vaginalis (strain ATCC PRA-98 / G3) TaxID=412133 RepID=A2DCU7_TRIV3|nr:transcription factor, enhancer of yellow 2 family [Trichomonas vaginalis G3]EAY21721.1 hypothetical protein TVAG_237470 [Trichomonas vaginalis G3]KAI5496234.1 transcription factor, enhancer of yellow 2 family [Trichomonas vaginalis G3]|eukprot:XP_001582707.1 hypothetical protein [Trichomonas vaginalis G3]